VEKNCFVIIQSRVRTKRVKVKPERLLDEDGVLQLTGKFICSDNGEEERNRCTFPMDKDEIEAFQATYVCEGWCTA